MLRGKLTQVAQTALKGDLAITNAELVPGSLGWREDGRRRPPELIINQSSFMRSFIRPRGPALYSPHGGSGPCAFVYKSPFFERMEIRGMVAGMILVIAAMLHTTSRVRLLGLRNHI